MKFTEGFKPKEYSAAEEIWTLRSLKMRRTVLQSSFVKQEIYTLEIYGSPNFNRTSNGDFRICKIATSWKMLLFIIYGDLLYNDC